MKCLYPVIVRNGIQMDIVPCGRCIVCKENNIRQWFVRIMCEVGYCDYAKFLTLTYDEEHNTNTLAHKDFQDYVKRVRKALGVIKLKYYMCGEYGELKGRPHYHAIMLVYGDIGKTDLSKVFRENWKMGYVQVGTVTPRSVRYCLDYMQKLKKLEYLSYQVKPYQKMSQGLGLCYLQENEEQISELKYLAYKNVKYDVPRYFKKKSEIVQNATMNPVIDKVYAQSMTELFENKFGSKKRSISAKAEQIKKNIIARKKIKRGRL